MATSISMIFVDVTVLPVALPTIERELGATQLSLQWLINSYLLAFCVFLLAGGRAGDMLGYRKVFCLGMVVFALSSAVCGLSSSIIAINIFRAFQGIGGAFLIPTTTAILFSSFPQKERGRAIGLYVSFASIFLTIGPLLGGFLTEYLSWRYVFWINLPIAAIGLFLTLNIIPPSEKKKESFDWIGFFTLGGGISFIILAVMQAPSWKWTSPLTLSLLIIGLLLIFFLIAIDRKINHPLIDFSIFRNPLFLGGNLSMFLTQFLVMVTVFWAVYFQTIRGLSPSQAGLIALLPNAPVLFMAPLAGYLTDRLGPRAPVLIGFFLLTFSLLWFNVSLQEESFWYLFPALIPFGMGVSCIFTPSSVASLSQMPEYKKGIASAINNTLRQVGATLGMALIGTIFLHQFNHFFSSQLLQNPSTKQFNPEDFEGLLAGSPKALSTLHGLSPNEAHFVTTSYQSSFTNAFAQINFLAAAIAILGFIAAFFLLKKRQGSRDTG
jgi:EmrB/QacA subfamily drug resistance transporter